MELTQNPSVLELVRKTAELTTPKEIVWIDGSEAQLDSLRKIAVETGELIKLNEEKLPGCYLNRSDINDVARVEGRTFICSRTREEAGPTNNWMDPDEMKAKLHEILRCAMTDRTMYVIPYSMGVIGTPFAKYGIEITDSIYVVLNMAIMTRIGTGARGARRQQRCDPRRALQGHARPRKPLHRPLPGGEQDRLGQL